MASRYRKAKQDAAAQRRGKQDVRQHYREQVRTLESALKSLRAAAYRVIRHHDHGSLARDPGDSNAIEQLRSVLAESAVLQES
ncbi:MAG TPA: hypothetical protein VJ576_02725 [Rhodocyclaceae bacterium]|nr:hypothetical protein [Rhodocyclaceae bacterium]